MRTVLHHIDGQSVASDGGGWLPLVYPATAEVFGQASLGGALEVDRAVDAARRALRGPWGRMSTAERLRLLERLADAIDARSDAFIEAEVRDTGKPVSFARSVDVPRGASNFRMFASIVRASGTAAFRTDTPDGAGAINYVERTPVGVVAVICPWNLPLLLLTWKVAPALALGNTVVVKPSEETPQTATMLAELATEIGFPAGVLNVVHGLGPASAGEALVRHPGIDAITFTGESGTGAAIMRAAADHVRPVSFELGGKNAALVFDDCDLDAAVAGTLRSTFANCGQVCLCSERIYVQRRLFPAFVARLVEGARAMRIGDPFDDATGMGPVISAVHRDKVVSAIDGARRDGGDVLCGGAATGLDDAWAHGFFVAPTVVTGTPEIASFAREEVFGPVCHVAPFDDEDDAVALANDTPYGLCAAIWTRDVSRAHRVASRLRVGIVWVNDWFVRDLRTPFGGVGLSGIGREGGVHSLDFYAESKTICVKL